MIRVCLDEVLRRRGMTAKELCALVGITEANLSILRSNKARGVRFNTLDKICRHLECSVADILVHELAESGDDYEIHDHDDHDTHNEN
jgi:putative transcriptional regulator